MKIQFLTNTITLTNDYCSTYDWTPVFFVIFPASVTNCWQKVKLQLK